MNISKISTILAIILFTFGVSATEFKFEQSERWKKQTLPLKWTARIKKNKSAIITLDSKTFHSGTKSLKIFSSEAASYITINSPLISIAQGTKGVGISIWSKYNSCTEAKCVLISYNKTGKTIQWKDVFCFKKDSDWENNYRFMTIPAYATNFRISIRLKGKGTIWFDDLILKENKKNPKILCEKYRKLWKKRTSGENLARGKKVSFSVKPNYYLTKRGNTDSTDLTDGILSSRTDGTIWFDKRAVGWGGDGANNANMTLDLGSVQPIGNIVLRCLAGKPQPDLSAPQKLEVFVSKDKKKWYQAVRLIRLMSGEKDLSDFKTCYYLSQTGTAYVYPMELAANCDARYINVKISGPERNFISDELAVMKASDKIISSSNFNTTYKGKTVPVFDSGILLAPDKPFFAISKNIITPNFLAAHDMRTPTEQQQQKTIKLVIELPAGIELISPSKAKKENIVIDDKAYIRWTMPYDTYNIIDAMKNPLFFKVTKNYSRQKTDKAIFYANTSKYKPNKVTVPLKIITIPEVPKLNFHVSLAWMLLVNDTCSEEFSKIVYPDFFELWTKMGFNALGTSPYIWATNPNITSTKKALVKKAKKYGYKIIMNYSPGHTMEFFYGKHREMYTQNPEGKSRNLCPAYRGKYYKKELQHITKCMDMTSPNYIFWDMECWHRAKEDSKICSRCIAGQKAARKPMNEYLLELGTEINRDLYNTVKLHAKEKGIKMPLIGSYDRCADKPIYGIEEVKRIYPKYIKLLQPSLYIKGNAQIVHDSVRKNYQTYKTRNIIPWLTAGTYGEFESYKLEQMIYETMLNGAGGFTYFCYYDFDTPMDFYYHAKALKTLAPYQKLIMTGKVLFPTGSNKSMTYSGIRSATEMLLLIGNYTKCNPKTVFNVPFGQVQEVENLLTGKKITNSNKIKINVPKGKVVLLYIKGK